MQIVIIVKSEKMKVLMLNECVEEGMQMQIQRQILLLSGWLVAQGLVKGI